MIGASHLSRNEVDMPLAHPFSRQKRSRAATLIQATYRGGRAREGVIQSALCEFERVCERISCDSSGVAIEDLSNPVTVPRSWLQSLERAKIADGQSCVRRNFTALPSAIISTPSPEVAEGNEEQASVLNESVRCRLGLRTTPEEGLTSESLQDDRSRSEEQMSSTSTGYAGVKDLEATHVDSRSRPETHRDVGEAQSDAFEGIAGSLAPDTDGMTGLQAGTTIHVQADGDDANDKGLIFSVRFGANSHHADLSSDFTYSDGEDDLERSSRRNDEGDGDRRSRRGSAGLQSRSTPGLDAAQDSVIMREGKGASCSDASNGVRCSVGGIAAASQSKDDKGAGAEKSKIKANDGATGGHENGSRGSGSGRDERDADQFLLGECSLDGDSGVVTSARERGSCEASTWVMYTSPTSSIEATPLRGEAISEAIYRARDAQGNQPSPRVPPESSGAESKGDRDVGAEPSEGEIDEQGLSHASFSLSPRRTDEELAVAKAERDRERSAKSPLVLSPSRPSDIPAKGPSAPAPGNGITFYCPKETLVVDQEDDPPASPGGDLSEQTRNASRASGAQPWTTCPGSGLQAALAADKTPEWRQWIGREWGGPGDPGMGTSEYSISHKTMHELEEELDWLGRALESRIRYLRSRSDGIRRGPRGEDGTTEGGYPSGGGSTSRDSA